MSTEKDNQIRGRGTASRIDPRYGEFTRSEIDDGWENGGAEAGITTTVTLEHPRTLISRNNSPDVPFEQSINPYRGCEHGCVYCLSGDALVLMADGTTRLLAKVRPGDLLYGTVRRGWYRRYEKSRVLDHWSVVKPAYRIRLADGTQLVAGPDHRFLTERGWKFVTGEARGHVCRPHLTTNNKLMGTGRYAASPKQDEKYRTGYLCGMIRGDGLLASYHYERVGRKHGDQYQFRLALCDEEALDRTRKYLEDLEIKTFDFVFKEAAGGRRRINALRTSARDNIERVRSLVAWPERLSGEWAAGFLAGIFDSEGSYSQGVLRISNSDEEIIAWLLSSLKLFDFRFVVERVERNTLKPITVIRLIGGLREHLRFFHSVDTAIPRKRDIVGQAVKSDAKLEVSSIEPLGRAMRLYDITTETGDFIANGVISHNCYARPTHAYMDLSPGIDFESKLFAKPDAPALLKKELAKPGYVCKPIAMGTNTDPYQPIERRYRITREIIEVLAEARHPLTIVTKSWLVERDMDLLAPMAAQGLVWIGVSVTTLRRDLARRLEPRASSPGRRIETLAALSEAGIPAGVMFAPVIPFLNDEEMESVLERAAQAGAGTAGYVLVRLPREIKDLFREWLSVQEPGKAKRIMSAIRDLRGGRDNDAQYFSRMRGTGVYAELIRRRFETACRRLGLNRADRDLRTDLFCPPSAGRAQLDLF